MSCTLEISILFLTVRNMSSLKEFGSAQDAIEILHSLYAYTWSILIPMPKVSIPPVYQFSYSFPTINSPILPANELTSYFTKKTKVNRGENSPPRIYNSEVLPTLSPIRFLSSGFMGRIICPLVGDQPLHLFFTQFHQLFSDTVITSAVFSISSSSLICKL